MNFQSDQVLTKTPQGVNATRSGVGLPPGAHAMLKLLDGTMPVAAFKAACLGAAISETDFQATLQDLVKLDHLRVAADAAAAAVPAQASAAERRLLQTLDFTVDDLVAAAAPAKPAAAAGAVAAMPVAIPAAPRAAPAADMTAAFKGAAQVQQQPVTELQPRIEEELHAKLRLQLEQELRPKLIAALRPGIEAQVRTALTKELAPRVELELKARFAKSLAAQKVADQQAARPQPVAAAPSAADAVSERLLASLSTPLFSVDKNGVCRYVSPAWEPFSGFAAAELLGKPLADYFLETDRRAITVLLAGVSSGTALRFEQQGALRRKEGAPLWVEIVAAPVTAPDGALTGACGLIRDAVELRRALEQAEADAVRLVLLVDQVDTAVILEDAGGNIQQANAALCTLLSLEAAPYSLEGTPVAELLQSVAGRFIAPDGFVRRVGEMRAANADVKGASFVMADGRVIEQDYLAVTVGNATVGRLWLFRPMARAPARAAP